MPTMPSFSVANLMQGVTQGGVAALQGAIALKHAQHSLADMRKDVTGAGKEGQGFLSQMRQDLKDGTQLVHQTVEEQGNQINQTMEDQGNQMQGTVTTQGNQLQQQVEGHGTRLQQTAKDTSTNMQATLEEKTTQVEERFENQMADLEGKYTELEEQGRMTEEMWEQFEQEMAELEAQKEAELARVRQTLDNADAAIDQTSANASASMTHLNAKVLENQRLLQEQIARQEEENARLRALLEQQATGTTKTVVDVAHDTRVQTQAAIADTTTQAQNTLSTTQTAVGDTRTEVAAAIADTRAETDAAINQTQSQAQASLAAADEAVADASVQSQTVLADAQTAVTNTQSQTQASLDAIHAQAEDAVVDTQAHAQAAVDDVHSSSFSALEDAQRDWVAQTVVVGSSAEQLGRHLQYFEPGRQLESYLHDQERAALESAQAQFADALTTLEIQRDEEIELVLTGFEYDDFITARDEAVEEMVAADITGQAREVALQAASFEYRYDGTELTTEQREKIEEINARYQKQAVGQQEILASQVQQAVHTSAARLGDGFLSFQVQYASLVGQMTQETMQAQAQFAQSVHDSQAFLEEENRRLQEEADRTAQQLALTNARSAVRLEVADFSIAVQQMVGDINAMTSEQLEKVAFKLSHAKELKERQAEFVRLYKRLVDVELDYVRDESGGIVLEKDGSQRETRDIRELRDLRERMINVVPERKKALLKEKQMRPQVTVSLGKKKG